MTDVVLFHHAQGLTDGMREFAGQLRAAGHQVTLPDLFDGRTFGSIEEGVRYAGETGFDTIIERGRLAAQALPEQVVYAGFSLGVLPAQMLAQTRSRALGALLLEGCVPVSEFGSQWPPEVPVQIHGMDADPYFAEEDLPAARLQLAGVERHLRAGRRHADEHRGPARSQHRVRLAHRGGRSDDLEAVVDPTSPGQLAG